MSCQTYCPARPLAHFIGHKRMNSVILADQEDSSSWVIIAELPLYPLRIWFPANTAERKKSIWIIFLFLLYTVPLYKANVLLWWKLLPTVWQCITHLPVPLSFLFLSSMFRHWSSQRWPERTSLNMASTCPDPDESLLSRFPSILLLHINFERDYLPACQSRCSEEKRRAKSFLLISLPWD